MSNILPSLPVLPPIGAQIKASSAGSSSVASLFKGQLDQVNAYAKASSEMKTRHSLGDPNVSLAETMIVSQKSKVAMTLAIELRNKALETYKDIISMPV